MFLNISFLIEVASFFCCDNLKLYACVSKIVFKLQKP